MQQNSRKLSIPWTGLDVFLLLALWFVAHQIVFVLVVVQMPEQSAMIDKKDHRHPIIQMIEQGKNSPAVLLIAFLAVVVAAPFIEEFLFRLLFQGWLETKLGSSGIAIVVVSLCFALIHGGNNKSLDGQVLFYLFAAMIAVNLLVFAMGIIYLQRIKNVKLTHIVFGTGRFFPPRFFVYAGYCLLMLLPIFGITFVLNNIYPNINTDPIPVFLLSLVLGILYSRTHNLSYCIMVHACLNATSLTIAYASGCAAFRLQ